MCSICKCLDPNGHTSLGYTNIQTERITCRCLMSLLMAAVITGELTMTDFMLAFSVDR
uniref:Uncharacterized protein n=1 Tax=Amphiprion ocellaris TaxID=80972 RepID=A0AAQ5YA76_AMPOC